MGNWFKVESKGLYPAGPNGKKFVSLFISAMSFILFLISVIKFVMGMNMLVAAREIERRSIETATKTR